MAAVSINTGIPRPDKSAFDVPPGELKPLAMARRRWAEIDLPCDCRLMKQVYDEAPIFAEAMGYKSGDQFIEQYLGLDLDLVARVLGWLEREQPTEAVPLSQLTIELESKPYAAHGGDRLSIEPIEPKDQVAIGHLKPANQTSGNSQERILRRLWRDRPDLAQKIADGEIPSARAAAIEAGIVRRTIQVDATDPVRIAASLRRHLDQQQITALVEALTCD